MPEAATHVGSGKVRELFELDEERLLLVASDRISTFDVVLPTEIPDKGRVLTGLSGFWFARTRELVPNHLLGLRDDGRSTECRRLEMLPLGMMNGKVIVATEDPSRRDRIDEAEFLTQSKVVPVLPATTRRSYVRPPCLRSHARRSRRIVHVRCSSSPPPSSWDRARS